MTTGRPDLQGLETPVKPEAQRRGKPLVNVMQILTAGLIPSRL